MATDGSSTVSGPITLPGDPTLPLQAATKQYVDAQRTFITSNYLPLTGGTLSGGLTVAGNGVAYSTYGGNAIGYGWDGSHLNAFVNNTYIGALATQAYVGSVGGNYLPLSGGTISGALTVTGAVSMGALGANLNATGHDITSISSLGTNFITTAGMNCTGTASAGNVNVSSTVTTNVATVTGTGIAYTNWGNNNHIAMNWASGNNLQFYVDGAFVGSSFSDARVKNVIGTYEYGLRELLRLEPVRYRLKGNDRGVGPDAGPSPHDTRAVNVGVVAQQAEQVMPEMFCLGSALIDGVRADDVRLLDSGPWVLWATVNAVKELAARVAALEARLAA